jgi:hypothetical protein
MIQLLQGREEKTGGSLNSSSTPQDPNPSQEKEIRWKTQVSSMVEGKPGGEIPIPRQEEEIRWKEQLIRAELPWSFP